MPLRLLDTDHISDLKLQRIRIGTQDLKIAAIALASDATVITRKHAALCPRTQPQIRGLVGISHTVCRPSRMFLFFQKHFISGITAGAVKQ